MSRPDRYIITIEDRRHLRSVLRRDISLQMAVVSFIVIIILVLAAGFLIGYRSGGTQSTLLGVDDRTALSDMLLRLDSLNIAAEQNRLYIENITTILDIGRIPADTADAAHQVAAMPPDSLMEATDAERAFVRSMEQQGGLNASALASIAAERLIFESPTPSGVQTQASNESEVAEILVPSGDPILTPADARVADLYFSGIDGGYTLILQHPRGFLTRISGLGRVIVEAGTWLHASDPVGFGPGRDSYRRGSIQLRMWHNGKPLVPAQYISLSGNHFI